MTRYFGGDIVTGGTYWSRKAGEFVSVPAEGGQLGGGQADQYVRTPLPLALMLGPLMGAAFAMSLPLSGMLVLAPLLLGRLRSAAAPGAAHMAVTQPRAGLSYLEAGTGPARNEQQAVSRDAEALIKLAESIVEDAMRKR